MEHLAELRSERMEKHGRHILCLTDDTSVTVATDPFVSIDCEDRYVALQRACIARAVLK